MIKKKYMNCALWHNDNMFLAEGITLSRSVRIYASNSHMMTIGNPARGNWSYQVRCLITDLTEVLTWGTQPLTKKNYRLHLSTNLQGLYQNPVNTQLKVRVTTASIRKKPSRFSLVVAIEMFLTNADTIGTLTNNVGAIHDISPKSRVANMITIPTFSPNYRSDNPRLKIGGGITCRYD